MNGAITYFKQNFAVNDYPQRAVARMKDGRFRLVPKTAETRGHGTHTVARFWKDELADLLQRTE